MAEVGANGQPKHFPKDGLVIISLMKELGITSYEPRVVTQLLEFTVRYVSSVLDDARAFATHSKKRSIDIEDVKLAVMMQLERVFTSPPPRDLLLDVARTKNNTPLPIVKPHCGIRLPPDRYCFSTCNYRLKSSCKKYVVGDTNKFQSKFSMNTSGLSSKSAASSPGTGFVGSSMSTSLGIKRPATVNVAAVARTQPSSPSTITTSKPIAKFTSNPVIVNTGGQLKPGQARIISGSSSGAQLEVKIEAQDVSSIKRKREDIE